MPTKLYPFQKAFHGTRFIIGTIRLIGHLKKKTICLIASTPRLMANKVVLSDKLFFIFESLRLLSLNKWLMRIILRTLDGASQVAVFIDLLLMFNHHTLY